MTDHTIPAITPEKIAELRALFAKATGQTNTRPACPKSSDDTILVLAAVNALPALLDLASSALSAQAGRGSEQTAAARDVLAERQRQTRVEGWTAEHDAGHGDGSLATAAAIYADPSLVRFESGKFGTCIIDPWPWRNRHDAGRGFYDERAWWKPSDRRRDLVKAGALILAEIERLDRASPPPPAKGGSEQ